jgi:large subunit ribosomal protein L5
MTQETTQSARNAMQRPRIEKVVINICIGKSGEPLERAMDVLQQITGHKACQRKAKRTVRDWGVRQGEPIACMVSLRGETARAFLKRALDANGNRLQKSNFDTKGNFSFGIREHIQLPGVRYDPAVGIFGMDVCTAMAKDGYRVKRRRYLKSQVGKAQLLTPEESMNYLKESFRIEIID